MVNGHWPQNTATVINQSCIYDVAIRIRGKAGRFKVGKFWAGSGDGRCNPYPKWDQGHCPGTCSKVLKSVNLIYFAPAKAAINTQFICTMSRKNSSDKWGLEP